MDAVIWEAPPRRTRGPNTEPSAEAEALRSKPGVWARVFEFDKPLTAGTTASTIKKGTRKGFEPAGAFDAVSRTMDGKGVVYARFVGDN